MAKVGEKRLLGSFFVLYGQRQVSVAIELYLGDHSGISVVDTEPQQRGICRRGEGGFGGGVGKKE